MRLVEIPGWRGFTTLTVGGLREMLAQFPDEMPVALESERTRSPVGPIEGRHWQVRDGVLFFDADNDMTGGNPL